MQSRQPSQTSQIMRLFLSVSWAQRHEAILSILSPMGAVFTNIGIPFLASRALVSILHANNHQFNHYMLLLALVAAAGILANRIGFVNMMSMQAKSMDSLHAMVFERLLNRGVSFHTNQIGGKLVSDALDFISAYSTLLTAVYNTGFSFLAVLVIGLIIVTINSWILGLFVFVTIASTLWFAYLDSRRRSNLRTARLQATKDLTSHLSDSIVNAQTVKTFAGEGQEIMANRQLNIALRELRLRDWRRAGISGNNRSALLVVMMVVLLLVVKYGARYNPNVVATGLFAFTYTFTLLLRLFDINTLTRQIEESFLQATPIMLILKQADEIKDIAGAKPLRVVDGVIKFGSVAFRYPDASNTQAIFENFNLDIGRGEKVGIVGPSGGGKTTLTRLLLRFEDVQAGSITIDGQNISQVTQSTLRQAIAYVPQEPLLFHRSIKENIAYGRTSATDDEIVDAARLASADEFIAQLPHGYDTVVGERGVKLSGGQRQRVAIARAILKNAPILVLDEATSALDSESEVAIQSALAELMKGRTTLVIAHRLSTIQKMDRIVVLDEGRVAESGSHQQLLRRKGLYAKLWHHQSGGFIEE